MNYPSDPYHIFMMVLVKRSQYGKIGSSSAKYLSRVFVVGLCLVLQYGKGKLMGRDPGINKSNLFP